LYVSEQVMPQYHGRQQNRTTWSARTLLTYSLLQLPGLVLVLLVLVCLEHWGALSAWLCWGLMALWMAKDIMMFPFVWRSYDPDLQSPPDTMIGQVGITRQRLAPTGYIRVHGALWRAEVASGGPPVEPGKPVKVEARHRLTLTVAPAEDAARYETW
jgi:membrane-bound ClpP family serine protease